jgi:FtsZ-interacting cell division protein ZipA
VTTSDILLSVIALLIIVAIVYFWRLENKLKLVADARQDAHDALDEESIARQNKADARQDSATVRQDTADARQEKAADRQNVADKRQEKAADRQNIADERQNQAADRQDATDAKQSVVDVAALVNLSIHKEFQWDLDLSEQKIARLTGRVEVLERERKE